VARALAAVCASVDAALAAASAGGPVRPAKAAVSVSEAADALRQAQVFMSEVEGPPESDDEQQRLTSTLHALDDASRLAEAAGNEAGLGAVNSSSVDSRAVQLCLDAMRSAAAIAGEVAALPDPHRAPDVLGAPTASAEGLLVELEHSAKALDDLRRTHRSETLSAVASGALTAGE